MRAAREHGINFLDDARYNDETGTAPIPTGYSEVAVRRAVPRGRLGPRRRGRRQQAVVGVLARRRTPPQELDGSLGRMRLRPHRPDLRQPAARGARPVAELVRQVGGLMRPGKARAWAIVNWEAEPSLEASQAARTTRACRSPCAAQLPYSLVQRDWVEGPEMTQRARGVGRRRGGLVRRWPAACSPASTTPARAAAPAGELDGPGSAPAREKRPRRCARSRRRSDGAPARAGDRVRARQPRGRQRAVRRHKARADRRERDGPRRGRGDGRARQGSRIGSAHGLAPRGPGRPRSGGEAGGR